MDNGIETKRFDDFGFDCDLDHTNPTTPTFTEKTLQIPGRRGLWNFGNEIGTKAFNFNLTSHDRSYDRVQVNLNKLNAFLFDEFGQARELKVIFDYEVDKYILMKASSHLSPERAQFEKTLPISFMAYKPNKQFVAESDEVTWDSDVIPITSDISWLSGISDFVVTKAETIEIVNDGNQIAQPTILIRGTANSLTFMLNGERFSFGSITMPIEIEAEKYLVYVNGIENITAMTGKLDKLYLKPGINNIVVEGEALNLTMSVIFRNQYL